MEILDNGYFYGLSGYLYGIFVFLASNKLLD